MNHNPITLNNFNWGLRKNMHSRKECWCGGHNQKNVSRNLNHHGTKNKFLIRKSRVVKLICKK